MFVASCPALAGAPASGAAIALSSVGHTLEGTVLVISGLVLNRGPAVAGLVIDASGFSAGGTEIAAGSDGIPWQLPSGGAERFSISLPVGDRLIRDYTVQIAYARPPFAAIARVRRGVDLALYRSLILSMVHVDGDLLGIWLIVSDRSGALPVAQITAEATLLIPGRKVATLQTLTLSVPGNGRIIVTLGIPGAALVSLRVTDVLLKTNWSD